MSPKLPPSFSGEWIQQTTEAVANFIGWIAELIRHRNWFKLLVLLGVALSVVSVLFRDRLAQWFPALWPSLIAIIAAIFVSALVVALVTLPRPRRPQPADLAERKAIKGLRPFSFADAEIFAQLQRQHNLHICLASLTSNSFRFGILMGESGCGKTSFLQAGVWPKLSQPEASHRGIYVRFSDLDPITSLRQALAKQLELPDDWLQTSDFLALLQQAVEAAGKPVVLLLDQFEQFFVHRPQQTQRQAFIQALTDWYRQYGAGSAQARSGNAIANGAASHPVKILVSIRSDLMYELDALHQALDYSLSAQDVFQLKQFTPKQASRILEAIAQSEQLPCDPRFLQELAAQELANREDGLISPVDLQILAWMIDRQSADELRAFNRVAFQKFGGVEGLLTRFLDRSLSLAAIGSEARRQAAIKVMLALTDLDRSVRAGVLTDDELITRLRGTLKTKEVREALRWLARGDVRLVTPLILNIGQSPIQNVSSGDATRTKLKTQNSKLKTGYELAHERLIPALMRLAGKALTQADKANQLLDRRVNEWLGNRFSRRYLLNLWELWQIERQRPYLIWGTRRNQKERLLRLSRWRLYRFVGLVVAIGLPALGYSGWLFFTDAGTMQRVRWALARPLAKVSDGVAAQAAVAFAKDGRWNKAFGILHQDISQPDEIASFLERAADIAAISRNEARLSQVFKIATNLQEVDASRALQAIASACARLPNSKRLQTVLNNVLNEIGKIENPNAKFQAWITVARAYEKLQNEQQAEAILRNALNAAGKIKDPYNEPRILAAIIEATKTLKNKRTAQKLLQQILDNLLEMENKLEEDDRRLGEFASAKVDALIAIVERAGKSQDKQSIQTVLSQVLNVVTDLKSPADKVGTLIAIARVVGNAQDRPMSEMLLDNAITAANSLPDNSGLAEHIRWASRQFTSISDKSEGLTAIVAVAGQLQSEQTVQKIQKILANSLTEITDPQASDRIRGVLVAIAKAAGQLQNESISQSILTQVLKATEKLKDSYRKNDVLTSEELPFSPDFLPFFVAKDILVAVAEAAGQLQDDFIVQSIMNQLLNTTNIFEDSYQENDVLVAIANTTRNIQNKSVAQMILSKVLKSVAQIKKPYAQAEALIAIAEAAQNAQDKSMSKISLIQALTTILDPKKDDVSSSFSEVQLATNQEKSEILVAAAKIAQKFQNPQTGQKLLNQILTAAETIENSSDQTDALIAVAEAAQNRQDAQMAQTVLEKALMTATTIESFSGQADGLVAVAAAVGKAQNKMLAQTILSRVLAAADKVKKSKQLGKSEVLAAIMEAASTLQMNRVPVNIWQDLLKATEEANESSILSEMAVQQARMGKFHRVLQTLRHCPEWTKVVTLTKVLSLWAERKNLTLINEAIIETVRPIEQSGHYVFEVTIRSSDRNCDDHADWWEVVSASGELLSRTFLEQPHLDSTPFQSDSNPFDLEPERVLIVRTHWEGVPSGGISALPKVSRNSGYADQAQWGSIATGFQSIRLSAQFAGELVQAEPQPKVCQGMELPLPLYVSLPQHTSTVIGRHH